MHRAFRKSNRKVPQKRFHVHYCFDVNNGIDVLDFVIFKPCVTYEQLKERNLLVKQA